MVKYLLAFVALLTFPLVANADVILTFGQASGLPIHAVANAGGTQTTITANNAPVSITEILGGSPTGAFFDLNITSIDNATGGDNGGTQHYTGSFSITSGLNDTGTNFLSGTFTDVVLGVGPSGVLAAGSPPDNITFTSSVIPLLVPPSAIALAFANVTPAFHVTNETIASFDSSVSGTFSASAVPEPATLTLMAGGLLSLGIIRKRRA